ncbi:MAG: coagulation factor 5/8 type domain-containing protein [Edaphobacter sp.]
MKFGLSLVLLTFAIVSAKAATPVAPDFGPGVLIFSPSTPSAEIQSQIDKIYATQRRNEFGPERNAILFLPGDYHVDIPIGFYTQILGLGTSPDSVNITGNVHSDAAARNNNATTTFWRAAENFSVTPSGGTMQWAVSQAAPFRRMHIKGDIVLHQNGGWASGGWMSDDLIDGNVAAGPQQQWISRNTEWHSWTGANWNMVFVGVPKPPEGEWPSPPYTKIAQTPIVREKPFLQVDSTGNYTVRVPSVAANTSGITWHSGSTPGTSLPFRSFYLAHPARDNAATINAQLAKGKNLLLTPGIYDLTEPIHITRSNTIVLGLGFATLRPVNSTAAITTADADGIIISGLLIDAGPTESPVLVQVGPRQSPASHAKNPISLHDVFFRVGGAGVGRAVINLEINSNDTIVDHTWIWRADHGAGVGWTSNTSQNGLVVNGNNVTIYGLFVEHHQQFQVLWNGNAGRTYFYQSEIPYDPPDQPSYTSAPNTNGWASYKVANTVTSHEAWGLGIYSVFLKPGVKLSRAIEVPTNPTVRFHDMITVALGHLGEIGNVINDTGGPTAISPRITPKVTNYP